MIRRGASTALLALAALLAAVGGAPAWADDAALPPASQQNPAQPVQPQPAQPQPVPRSPDGLALLKVAREGGALLLSAQLDFVLPSAVREALGKGVPVYFMAEVDIVRPRWYWKDRRLGQARRYWRLSYLPLTRRWRLSVSSEPLSEEGIGTGLAQHYDTLDDAVVALQRITGWRVAEGSALDGGGQQILNFSFWLDTAQLPRALQIGMTGQADWRLRVERRIDLAQQQDAPP